jgi:hypothetical protein
VAEQEELVAQPFDSNPGLRAQAAGWADALVSTAAARFENCARLGAPFDAAVGDG